jgi:hypothetical protein
LGRIFIRQATKISPRSAPFISVLGTRELVNEIEWIDLQEQSMWFHPRNSTVWKARLPQKFIFVVVDVVTTTVLVKVEPLSVSVFYLLYFLH